MTKIIGHRLPPELLTLLAAETPPREAVLLATTDERGYPHFALVSHQELLLARKQLHLFLFAGSRTAEFLKRSGRCTLAFVGPRGVFYVKGGAVEALRIEALIGYRIEVREVERDFPGEDEEGAAVVSGIEFTMSEASVERRSRLRNRLGRMLRGLGNRTKANEILSLFFHLL